MAMSCFYDRSAGDTEERSTCKTVVMRQGTNYNPEMESLASFRSMVLPHLCFKSTAQHSQMDGLTPPPPTKE